MQHLTDVVLPAAAIEPDVTVAHRRGNGKGVWPACLSRPESAPDGRWREMQAARALDFGAVPCTHSACVGGVTG